MQTTLQIFQNLFIQTLSNHLLQLQMVIPPSFKLARETCNKEFNYGFVWGSCLGFVGISCYGHLLEGV